MKVLASWVSLTGARLLDRLQEEVAGPAQIFAQNLGPKTTKWAEHMKAEVFKFISDVLIMFLLTGM